MQIEIINNEPKIDTRLIAKNMELEHRAIIRLVDKYSDRFSRLGTLSFENSKSGGRPIRFSWLNEPQSLFLCSLFKNSLVVLDFKEQVARDFDRMKKTLMQIKANQLNASWIETRNSGKVTRKEETDIIKEFVEYAISQGSKNAGNYYTNLTRMENKALFIIEQKFANVREVLDGQQLAILNTCDQAVAKSLRDGMKEHMHYKEIYKKAKDDVYTLVALLGQTYVPNQKRIK